MLNQSPLLSVPITLVAFIGDYCILKTEDGLAKTTSLACPAQHALSRHLRS